MLQVTTLPANGDCERGVFEPIRCCCRTRLFDVVELEGMLKIQVKCKDCNAYTVLTYRLNKS